MDDIVSRATDVVARAANSGAVAPGVAALCQMVGIAYGQPEAGMAVGVALGAAVGSGAEEMVGVAGRLWFDRVSRIERFAEAAESASGVTMEDLLLDVMQDRQKLELLAQVAELAARSLDDWKIDLLARVYVHGVRERSRIDESQLVVDAIRQLEGLHLRLLRFLSRDNPKITDASLPDTARWHVEEIFAEDEGLRELLDPLMAKLQSLGMVLDVAIGAFPGYKACWSLTPFGRLCAAYLTERGAHTDEG